MRVELKSAAIDDVAAARRYYDEARAGLGEEFLVQLDGVLGRLQLFPESAPVVDGYAPVRRANLRRFPFGVFYLPEADRIVVLRVLHGARDPKAWADPDE